MDDDDNDGRTHDHGGCGQHAASASWKSLLSPLNGRIDDDQSKKADSCEACSSVSIETITGWDALQAYRPSRVRLPSKKFTEPQ